MIGLARAYSRTAHAVVGHAIENTIPPARHTIANITDHSNNNNGDNNDDSNDDDDNDDNGDDGDDDDDDDDDDGGDDSGVDDDDRRVSRFSRNISRTQS